jgi:parvulin-like peptidyl-prolyl isomerase
MRHARFFLILAALVSLLVTACGGSDEPKSVPSDGVAVVGDRTITKAEYDRLMGQAKRGYQAQKRKFPEPGSQEYESLRQQAMQLLVQRAEYEQEAEDLDVDVSDEQVDERLEQVKKQYFAGNEKRYQQQIKRQGLTEEQVRNDIRGQLVSEKLFEKVTDDVKVTDADVEKYYKRNRKQYEQPESRDVRHILVKNKKTADRLYRRLKNGADFAALARKYSEDPGSRAQGGKLTIARGQTVALFDQTAFLLGKGTISRPLKTQYGYHIIQPLSAIKPKKVTPFSQVKEQIRQQLLQSKKQEAMNKWVEETRKKYASKTKYQVGYAPKATTSRTSTG